MTAFIKALSDVVALFLQALRLSVLLPAFILVGINVSVVLPLLRETRIFQMIEDIVAPDSSWILIAILVLLVAYVLAVLNVPIIRFFEGYPWLKLGNRLRLAHERRIAYLKQQIHNLDEERKRLLRASSNESPPWQRQIAVWQLARCEAQLSHANMEVSRMYPHHQMWRVMPTRLGNVIASAEEFPGQLYEIDSVALWPFLSPILTEKGYATFIEREKAIMDFLLNCSVITLVFGIELIYLLFLMGRLELPLAVFVLSATLAVAFCFYTLAIHGAVGWAYTIRVAFTLYRDTLRERLGFKRPSDFYEEQILWRHASRFLRDHDVTPGNSIFDYASRRSSDPQQGGPNHPAVTP